MKLRARLRAAEDRIEKLVAELERIKPAALRAWENQLIVCAMLEHLTDAGACVLPMPVRKKALEEEWGYKTEVPEIPEQPMIVTLLKPSAEDREAKVKIAVAGLLKDFPDAAK